MIEPCNALKLGKTQQISSGAQLLRLPRDDDLRR